MNHFFILKTLIYILYALVRLIINFFLFPGSFWLWRRNIENQFSKYVSFLYFCLIPFYNRAISKKTLSRIRVFKSLINILLKRAPHTEAVSRSELQELRKMLESFTDSFQSLTKQKTINRRQEQLSSLFVSLIQMMREVKLKERQEIYTMHELIMKRTNSLFGLLSDQSAGLEFEFEKQGEILLDRVVKLETAFSDNIEDKPRLQSLNRWMFNNSLGTIDQVKFYKGWGWGVGGGRCVFLYIISGGVLDMNINIIDEN